MCRTKELGGRRCPQHTDPVKHAAYNARRRELYAAKKTAISENTVTTRFPPIDINKTVESIRHLTTDERNMSFIEEANLLRNKIHPKYIDGSGNTTWSELDDEQKLESFHREKLIAAVSYYTSEGYTFLGPYLRREDPPEAAVRRYAATVAALDEVVETAGLRDEPINVYRGLRVPDYMEAEKLDSWIDDNFPIGGVISQGNYMSTSVNPVVGVNFAHNNNRKVPGVFFEILTRKGAALGDGVSEHSTNEHEILLPRNARLKVEGIVRNVPIEILYPDGIRKETHTRTFIRLSDAD
jgi:hypothetical protein